MLKIPRFARPDGSGGTNVRHAGEKMCNCGTYLSKKDPQENSDADTEVLREWRGRANFARPIHAVRVELYGLQVAGTVELFGSVQSGPKPDLASGTLSMAKGPALC
jgi:hypothetical protein